jgi:Cu/Ag efflux protein CusF
MKKIFSVAFLGLFALAGTAQAASEPAPAPEGASLVTLEASGTVEAIDAKTRIITIKGPEGNLLTTAIDNDVPNIEKIKKGDKVDLTYYQTLAWSLKSAKLIPEPAKTVTTTTLVGTDKKFPFKIETQKVDLFAKVTDLSMTNETVTLMGPEGKSETIKVKDPANLKGVKKGDIVEINYTEAVAAAVTKK